MYHCPSEIAFCSDRQFKLVELFIKENDFYESVNESNNIFFVKCIYNRCYMNVTEISFMFFFSTDIYMYINIMETEQFLKLIS